jgi:N-acyl-D-amino-acid deacylase
VVRIGAQDRIRDEKQIRSENKMTSYELVLRGGMIIDGTGAARVRADVAIEGDRIAAIGMLPAGCGRRELGIEDLIVAPGFIDVHTHDDRALLATDMSAKVSQGVTTVVTGNCGVSLAPVVLDRAPPPPLDLIGEAHDYAFPRFADYVDEVDAHTPALNAACLVGHSSLRVGCMSELDRAASSRELEEMRSRLAEGLAAGAVGLSTGLWYAPANAAPKAEIVGLAKLLRDAGAIYTTHMRDESEHVLDSLDESFAVGREAAVPVVISHHKVIGKANFGRTRETIARLERAAGEQPIGLDAYPYVASSTVLRPFMVPRALKVLVTWSKARPEMAGRYLAEIAAEWNVSQMEACDRLQPAGAVYWTMDEADVRRVLAFEHTMIGSDGLPHDVHPHPRLWGTFPRVLGHYARDVGLFSLEEAVRRMTGLPAQRFGLTNRGRIAAGCYADLCVFDPGQVIDRASFEAPATPAAGIAYVFVNGRSVWEGGAHTGARAGRVLRRQQMQQERAAA